MYYYFYVGLIKLVHSCYMKEKRVDVQHRKGGGRGHKFSSTNKPSELLAVADGGRNERQMEKSLPTCLPLCDREKEREVGGNGGK